MKNIIIFFLLISSHSAFSQIDKVEHFAAGFAINGLTTYGVLELTHRTGWSKLAGLSAGIAAGALKEYWDSKGYGDLSRADFFYTAAGSISFTIVLNIPPRRKESYDD